MKTIRTRVVVAIASSAVLASGLSVAAVAVGSVNSAAVPVASVTASGHVAVPGVTVYDP
jgi:hypothetical protein